MITPEQFELLLLHLEVGHLTRIKNALHAMHENAKAAKKRNPYDINANKALPVLKKDIIQVTQLLTVQENVLNLSIEQKYQFKFESFLTERYPALDEEVKKQMENMPSMQVDREETEQ